MWPGGAGDYRGEADSVVQISAYRSCAGFGPKQHVASRFVELSMLTANGRVRR